MTHEQRAGKILNKRPDGIALKIALKKEVLHTRAQRVSDVTDHRSSFSLV